MNGIYRTSDLYIAAWLLSQGLELQGIDCQNSRCCNFIFADRQDRSDLVHSFLCGRAVAVLPISFFTSGGQSGCFIRRRSKNKAVKKSKQRRVKPGGLRGD